MAAACTVLPVCQVLGPELSTAHNKTKLDSVIIISIIRMRKLKLKLFIQMQKVSLLWWCTLVIQELKKIRQARHLWVTSVILATQEAEIRRITIQSQLQANSSGDPISKTPITEKGWWSGSSGEHLPSKHEAL
jgi:hypothetical protein